MRDRDFAFYFDKETMKLTVEEKSYTDFYNALTGDTIRHYGESFIYEYDVNTLPKWKEKTNE